MTSTIVDVAFAGCLGALHMPAAPARSHAVVLCPAFGYEGVCTHRGLVALADDLADRGLPALRFDYPGSGDSIDLDPEQNAVPKWLDAIEAAARLLSRRFPGTAISLLGYRFGALLACAAAHGIDRPRGLVLLAPVPSGRGFLRELAAIHGAGDIGIGGAAGGWPISPTTAEQIAALSLERLAAPRGCDVLLAVPEPTRGTERLLRALDAGRAEIAVTPDLVLLNQHPHDVAVPEAAFATIVSWLDRRAGAAANLAAPGAMLPAATLSLPGSQEAPVRMGEAGRLFGIASYPNTPSADRPCLLILNSGGVPRAGHGRLSALLARELARDGVASLRVDLTGTGDTRPTLRTRNTDPYAPRAGDVRIALDWMEAAGWGPVVAFGLCSGAYFSLHGAVAEERIAGAIMVNIQSFLWPVGKDVTVVMNNRLVQVESYWTRLKDWRSWRGLLAGEVALARKLRALAMHYAAAGLAALQALLPARLVVAPRIDRIARMFDTLDQRGTPLLFVYSRGDPGINELQMVFGRRGRRLRRRRALRIDYIEDTDHTLTGGEAKRKLVATTRQFLQRHFPEPAPATQPETKTRLPVS